MKVELKMLMLQTSGLCFSWLNNFNAYVIKSHWTIRESVYYQAITTALQTTKLLLIFTGLAKVLLKSCFHEVDSSGRNSFEASYRDCFDHLVCMVAPRSLIIPKNRYLA